ncbi:MAG: gluconokinase, GntK/IdnK-type [Pseudomonadota bacterium]
MGPAACGKSTVAEAISKQMNWPLIEADDHHPRENVDKMSNGTPLTDRDRAAWLDSLIEAIKTTPSSAVVLACSALTPYVQSRLRDETSCSCQWWLIDLPREVLERRIRARQNHFMPAELIESQLASLTPPEDVIRINGDQAISKIRDEIIAHL